MPITNKLGKKNGICDQRPSTEYASNTFPGALPNRPYPRFISHEPITASGIR